MRLPRHHLPGALACVVLVLGGLLTATTSSAHATEDGDDTGTVDTDYGRMMLVLDSSGSMSEPAGGGQSKIEAARSALGSVIDDLPEQAYVGLRVFGATVFSSADKGACQDTQQVVAPGTDNRADLQAAVDDYKPYGETPIPAALRAAADDLGSEGARSIVLVSDGESTCAPDPCQVAGELADRGLDLQIDVVGLSVSGQAQQQLRCIAERGHGTYYDADSADEIAASLSHAAERAVRPFTLDGTPIEGGTPKQPTPITVGDWTDTLGRKSSVTGTRTYSFERTTAGTTLRVAALTQSERGAIQNLYLTLTGPDGEDCATSSTYRGFDVREVMAIQATGAPENDCGEPGTYLITVTRDFSEEAIPIGLRVTEEPPVTDPGTPEPPGDDRLGAPSVSGSAKPVVGGASFGNAGEIGEGRWSSDIVPGEALLYRLPLEFGQSARIRVTFPKATPAMQDVFGAFPPFCSVTLYNPMHAETAQPGDTEECVTASAEVGGEPTRTDILTGFPTVSRDAIEFDTYNGTTDSSVAGDHYLSVSLQREDYSIAFPLTIDVQIVGDPQQGPTYADAAQWSVADDVATDDGADDKAGDEADDGGGGDGSGAKATEGDSDSPVRMVVAGALGALGLVALLSAGVLLIRRRRRRPSPRPRSRPDEGPR